MFITNNVNWPELYIHLVSAKSAMKGDPEEQSYLPAEE